MRIVIFLICIFVYQFSHAQTLAIAITPFAPPFVMASDKNGHYIGFSIEIMQEICKNMQVKCHFKPMGFDRSLKAAMDEQVDLAIGNITILPSRKKIMLFSQPYLPSNLQFITLASSKIDTIEGARNKIIGSETGLKSPSTKYLTKKFGDNYTSKKYSVYTDLFIALAKKKIDIALMDKAVAESWFANSSSTFKLVGSQAYTGLGYGIVTSKSNTNLMDKVNKTLVAMEADGTYSEIYKTYFGEFDPR